MTDRTYARESDIRDGEMRRRARRVNRDAGGAFWAVAVLLVIWLAGAL